MVLKLVVGPFWDENIETTPVEELQGLQIKLLRKQLRRVYEKSRFYRKKFEERGVRPSQIRSLSDIAKVPFTTREELEKNFDDILSIPMSNVATIRQTSGTTGTPLTIAHSRNDLDVIANAYARKLTYHGVTSEDVVQVTATYGLWQGAWSVHSGAEKIGCFVLPVSSGDTERQIRLLKRFGTTVLYAVTNYHFRIAEIAKQLGEDLRSSSLRMGICVAEKPTRQQMMKLKEELGYETVMIDYGATEFPGFSVHCRTNPSVHHIWADYYLVEAVDPKTHEPLQEGGRGELVITSLQREAFPLVRYLSSDITEFVGFERCDCGLTHPKIGVDIDRKDFMAKVKGTPVFPSALEHIFEKFEELTGRSQVVVDKRTPKQEAILKVEVRSEVPKVTQGLLKRRIRHEIKSRVGVTVDDVIFVPFGTFEDKMKKSIVIE